ncbi:MAG TPA: UDP-N-acetylmuramoyl-L-alanyl-D-glutamate--2,6-diaminopimelate ligase, partial [Nitrospirae bacterium]|nr:UDP-N-acetylmuramoyl-L-alanyl-D-glutamate--2,6-diaminopimelate ligase [Nitrospirota bacterium]
AYDSRLVKSGYLFVAIKGFSVDGHTYIKDAINRGGVGVVVETIQDVQTDTSVVQVEDSRKALAFLSAAFYGEPSKRLSLIGITGTNGKTTTSYIIRNILETWGEKTGLLGTINYIIDKKVLTPSHTTPESLDLQRYLAEMADIGTRYAVLEVSSHALELQRVGRCSFKIAAFTNFSQDHLDFHKTMKEYFSAKSMLFDHLGNDGIAVLNHDDPEIRGLAAGLNCNVVTCGIEEGAMLRAENIKEPVANDMAQAVPDGLSFDIRTPEDRFTVESELIGHFNVYNILMSVGIAYALGIDRDTIIEGVRTAKAVEGRFEKIDEGQEFNCIIDYAHTEDALKNLLKSARLITGRRIITVFGCGGDRDRTKRPKMGAAASGLSDLVVITSDNPRTEGPMEIIRDITRGIKKGEYIVRPDRAGAIREAVSMAGKGDTLLIAGKGHESYQEISGIKHPFSDKQVVKQAIRDLKPACRQARSKIKDQ